MPDQAPYDSAFFAVQKDGSYNSARIVLPHVLSVCHPKSAVDFGCGVGTWLRVLVESGITDITGVDGDYVQDSMLVIPREHFVRADLTKPIHLDKTFDLVMSLEVAEHIQNDSAAVFIETLASHGKIVLFSAAVPQQGGTHHINEQWPVYWNSLFKKHGFTCFDCIREVFWEDKRIDWWYRQNVLLFVHESRAAEFAGMSTISTPGSALNLVHPDLFHTVAGDRSFGIRTLIKKIPQAVRTTLRSRMPNKGA